MIVPKKKDALRELALSLFLMLEFDAETAPYSLISRIRERATTALRAATTYTGIINREHIQDFLDGRSLKFTIPCKQDVVKGDTIQFTEDAYDGRRKPPRWLGKRNITAQVTAIRPNNGDPMLIMKVIVCLGAWILKPDVEIHRPLKVIARSDAKRSPWDNEVERTNIKNRPEANPQTMKAAAAETFTLKK